MENTIRQAHGRRPLPSIFNRQSAIVNEFGEPLREVVAGFIPMGMTRAEVAETLSVNYRSLRTFCEKTNVRFPVSQPGRAERIRETKRSKAPRLRLGRESRSVAEWSELYGINRVTLYSRLRRRYSLSDALKA